MVRGKTRDDLEVILPEIVKRVQDGEDVAALAQEFKIPKSTIYSYMKELNVEIPEKRGVKAVVRTPSAEQVVRKKEGEQLASEADKITTIAIGIGGPIARRYLPLIDKLMTEGKPLATIAEEVMTWYERKVTVERQLLDLQIEINRLNDGLSIAYAIAQPNFKYLLKVKTLEKYALQALRFKVAGFKVPVRRLLRAFQNDIEMIDKDLEEALEIKPVEAVVGVE